MSKPPCLAWLCLALGAAALGCTIPMTPKGFDIPDGSIHPVEGGTVEVRGSFGLKGRHKISLGTSSVSVDEDEYTTAVITRLAGQLRENGVRVEPGGDGVIEIQVVRVSVHPQPTFTCVIDFNRRFGDGPVRGLQSRAKSWDAEKACSAAVSQVVIDTLNDPHTREYLKGE